MDSNVALNLSQMLRLKNMSPYTNTAQNICYIITVPTRLQENRCHGSDGQIFAKLITEANHSMLGIKLLNRIQYVIHNTDRPSLLQKLSLVLQLKLLLPLSDHGPITTTIWELKS